jgi:hypothetical protein
MARPADQPTDPGAAVRRRRRARARQSAVFVAVFLVVIGIGIGAAGVNRGWWEGPFGAAEEEVAEGGPCPQAVTVQVDPASVEVTVLNATGRTGLAGDVTDELVARGLAVGTPGNAASGTSVTSAAQVRYGPEGERAAQGLASIVPGAELVADDGRPGTAVDLLLGEAYESLAPVGSPLTAVQQPDPASVPASCAPPTTPAPSPAPSAAPTS